MTPSKKGTGYIQPTKIHQEWHVDVSYINAGGTFYFLISVLDGYSRYIVHQGFAEVQPERRGAQSRNEERAFSKERYLPFRFWLMR